MNKLYIIRGLPGSGKSTIAKKILQEHDSDTDGWCEADMYFIRPDGVYDFNRALIRQAHAWCQSRIRRAMEYREVVPIVSNTFVKKWEMQPYFDMAKELGFDVEVIEAKGNYQNVHGVPDEVIERMRSQWEVL